jgi:sortase A
MYGSAMSHLAIAQFRAQSATNSLWDSARIRAYKRTLGMSFAPPEAILRIPKVGIEVPVLEGTSDATLNRGVGHIPGTALPGEAGNLAITGHRDGFFRPLKDIALGDIIEVQRPARSAAPAQTDRYVVQNTKIVFPADTSVLNQTTGQTLTLVTCYPFYFVGAAPQRFIVQATLLPASPITAMRDNTAPATASFVQPILGE